MSIRHTKNMFTMFKICDTSHQLVTFRKKDEWRNAKIVPIIQISPKKHNFCFDFVKCITACLQIIFTRMLS